jgi:hypothetical protein
VNYPWWIKSLGWGLGAALVAAMFSEIIFTLGRMVLPLSNATFEQWADDPPVGTMCLIVGVLVTVFALGIELGQRGQRGRHGGASADESR